MIGRRPGDGTVCTRYPSGPPKTTPPPTRPKVPLPPRPVLVPPRPVEEKFEVGRTTLAPAGSPLTISVVLSPWSPATTGCRTCLPARTTVTLAVLPEPV